MARTKKEGVEKSAPKFEIITPFIFAGKTYLPGDEKNVPQDAREAFTAKLERIEEYVRQFEEMENE